MQKSPQWWLNTDILATTLMLLEYLMVLIYRNTAATPAKTEKTDDRRAMDESTVKEAPPVGGASVVTPSPACAQPMHVCTIKILNLKRDTH